MTHSLAHRGPDDFGFMISGPAGTLNWKTNRPREVFDSPGVAFGHRRLSILDLSESGHQPFVSHDQRYWMIYNGEVYNYRELRGELTAAGYAFTTGTDTEVVIHAFAHWGPDCFNRFNGMWAIIIWDTLTQTLIVSRDRFGIKPLFFAKVAGDWIFASEAKAILLCPGFTAAPDGDVLFRFVVGHIRPESSTLFASIKLCAPATTMVIKGGVSVERRFWQPPEEINQTFRNVDEASEELRSLFTDSIKLRLRSDVRVGTMLSGGVDSPSVISTVRRQLDADPNVRNIMGERILAFNASFPGYPVDEAQKVTTICKYLDLAAHRVLPLDLAASDLESILDHTIDHLEMPFHNAVPIVLTLLMRKARSVGVKVVLNGHGADELFAGYPGCLFLALADMVTNFRFVSALSHFEGIHRTQGLPRKKIFRRARAVLNQPIPADTADTRIRGRSRVDRASRRDLFLRGLPHWLQMEDRISMSESIEARMPFLDYRIVEFALSLDDRMKISNGITKLVLRKAMEDRLPDSIVNDARKIRFSIPMAQWLSGALRSRLEAFFIHDTPLLANWLDVPGMRKTVGSFLQRPKPVFSGRVWRLLNAELCVRRYFGDQRTQ
jgi:asparagine synthase (glutamine-hydrolysing)